MFCPDCQNKMKKIIDVFEGDYYFCERCGHNTHPFYQKAHNKQKFKKVRKELTKALLKEFEIGITKDEILDEMIDIEIYNMECKKKKGRKRQ